jgi:hypothetical protein
MYSICVLVAREERWLAGGSEEVGGAVQDGCSLDVCLSGHRIEPISLRTIASNKMNMFTLPVGPSHDRYVQSTSAEQHKHPESDQNRCPPTAAKCTTSASWCVCEGGHDHCPPTVVKCANALFWGAKVDKYETRSKE